MKLLLLETWIASFLISNFKMSTTPSKRKRSFSGSPTLSEHKSDDFCYLEFYAGVGGWRMALNDAILQRPDHPSQVGFDSAVCVAALDHSDLCLQVYEHNFPSKKKPKSCRIEQINLQQLDGNRRADAWFMSPPCQPHTRQHKKQPLQLMNQLHHRPHMISQS